MRKYLRLILSNIIMLGFLYVTGYLYPDYSWSAKTLLYFTLVIHSVFCVYCINKHEEITDEMKERYTSTLWNVIDYCFDLIWVVVFIYLDYRLVFALYILQIITCGVLKHEIKEMQDS